MNRSLSSPLRYPGGKSQMYPYVCSLVEINEVKSYIEPFMGGAGVALKLLANKKVEKVFLNDFDRSIFAFWYSVLNHTERLIDLINNTAITIEEWHVQKLIQVDKENADLLALGFSTFFLNRTNRSGILKAGVIGGVNQNGEYKMDCRFNKPILVQRIIEISKLRGKIKLYNMDAEVFIRKIISRTKNSLTFFDPPYYEKGPELYTNFFKHDDHVSLSKCIKKFMTSKKWILTYDNSNEIKKIYNEYDSLRYYLRYSISKPEKGVEHIFFSKSLRYEKSMEYLNKYHGGNS